VLGRGLGRARGAASGGPVEVFVVQTVAAERVEVEQFVQDLRLVLFDVGSGGSVGVLAAEAVLAGYGLLPWRGAASLRRIESSERKRRPGRRLPIILAARLVSAAIASSAAGSRTARRPSNSTVARSTERAPRRASAADGGGPRQPATTEGLRDRF
jgi:hypothetical protein